MIRMPVPRKKRKRRESIYGMHHNALVSPLQKCNKKCEKNRARWGEDNKKYIKKGVEYPITNISKYM
jgi:hypothetical protein